MTERQVTLKYEYGYRGYFGDVWRGTTARFWTPGEAAVRAVRHLGVFPTGSRIGQVVRRVIGSDGTAGEWEGVPEAESAPVCPCCLPADRGRS